MSPTVTTTHWDVSTIRARAGQVYIMPYPTSAPSDVTTPHAILKSYFEQFYVDGDKKIQLITNLQPWAYIDSKGLILDPKYKSIPWIPALGLPINAGKYLEGLTGEVNIGDVSADKFVELLTATANEVLSLTTSSTLYSSVTKKGVLIGSQPYNGRYMMMYRFPSVNTMGQIIPNEWDHILLPRVYFDVEPKMEFNQSKPQDYKVKIVAEDDLFLMSPDSGRAIPCFFEETTAVTPVT